jgi:nucleoside-diphosphate-sugar epimerase
VRVFVAGATGVIGVRLVPLLIAAGHHVVGLTRSPEKAASIEAGGARAIVGDIYDADRLRDAALTARPDALVSILSDLPDEASSAAAFGEANARIRREGTRNLLAAARAVRVPRVVAFSVTWPLQGDGGAAVLEMERSVLDAGGVIVRCGRLYGPGTWHTHELPPPPRVHVDDAARRSVAALDAPSGVMVLADDGTDAER